MNNNDFLKYAKSRTPYQATAIESWFSKPIAGYVSPTIIEERPMNVAQLDVFSALMRDRIIVFGTEVSETSANIVTSQLLYLDSVSPGKPVSMYINSPGGSVYDGYGVIDTMDFIQSPVHTQVLGLAASMGAVFAVCGEAGQRYLLKHSRFMIHQPLGGVPGHSQATDIEIASREIQKIKAELIDILSERSGLDRETVAGLVERDRWYAGQEAVDAGFLDGVRSKP